MGPKVRLTRAAGLRPSHVVAFESCLRAKVVRRCYEEPLRLAIMLEGGLWPTHCRVSSVLLKGFRFHIFTQLHGPNYIMSFLQNFIEDLHEYEELKTNIWDSNELADCLNCWSLEIAIDFYHAPELD